MLWEKLTIDKLDNPTRGDHKLRPKGQSHRPETSRQTIDQPSTVLPVKHTSLTARTSNKLLVPRSYCCSNTYLLPSSSSPFLGLQERTRQIRSGRKSLSIGHRSGRGSRCGDTMMSFRFAPLFNGNRNILDPLARHSVFIFTFFTLSCSKPCLLH